jgi:hypothetical protein
MSLKKSETIKKNPVVWENTLTEIKKSMKELVISGKPEVENGPYGEAISFDGKTDGFFLPVNPLKDLKCFTVEVLIRPDNDGPEEQRFLHIGEIQGDRLLVETRTTRDGKWFLDTYIQSGESQKTLIDPGLVHPIGPWYHVAMTLDEKGQMTNYVNGRMELKGNVDFKPINSGETSIGVRRNKVSWYKGAIYKVKITAAELQPKDFMKF